MSGPINQSLQNMEKIIATFIAMHGLEHGRCLCVPCAAAEPRRAEADACSQPHQKIIEKEIKKHKISDACVACHLILWAAPLAVQECLSASSTYNFVGLMGTKICFSLWAINGTNIAKTKSAKVI